MSWHLPIGYEWVDGKIQVSESDAALVLRIFSEFNAGKSACQISKELNRENVPNAHGRVAWTHGAIGRILENPKYLGTDEYPQIIDLEMYLIAQKRRDEQREAHHYLGSYHTGTIDVKKFKSIDNSKIQ